MPSWLSASSASFPLPLSESREIGITGFAAIIALAGASGAGLGEGFGVALTGVCSLGPADLIGLAGLGDAFAAAGAAFAAGLAAGLAADVREETGLLLATGFLAGAAFLAGSAFFTDFLAFVAFADGFFAAIERASAPTDCRLLGRS